MNDCLCTKAPDLLWGDDGRDFYSHLEEGFCLVIVRGTSVSPPPSPLSVRLRTRDPCRLLLGNSDPREPSVSVRQESLRSSFHDLSYTGVLPRLVLVLSKPP